MTVTDMERKIVMELVRASHLILTGTAVQFGDYSDADLLEYIVSARVNLDAAVEILKAALPPNDGSRADG